MTKKMSYISKGEKSYKSWKEKFLKDSKLKAIYDEEAAKKELWLKLVEARQEAGLTQIEVAKRLGVSQAQVARIEKRGYSSHTINSLTRYIKALGKDFSLEILIRKSSYSPKPDSVVINL